MIMPERASAIIRVTGRTCLVLPFVRDEPPVIVGPAPLPFAVDVVIGVLEGEAEDFIWSTIGGHSGATDTGRGVAAALAARLFGLALGCGSLVGRDLGGGAVQRYRPPDDIWWHGVWRVGTPPEEQGCHARLILHGELVL